MAFNDTMLGCKLLLEYRGIPNIVHDALLSEPLTLSFDCILALGGVHLARHDENKALDLPGCPVVSVSKELIRSLFDGARTELFIAFALRHGIGQLFLEWDQQVNPILRLPACPILVTIHDIR